MREFFKFQTYKPKHSGITLALTNLYLLVNSNLKVVMSL